MLGISMLYALLGIMVSITIAAFAKCVILIIENWRSIAPYVLGVVGAFLLLTIIFYLCFLTTS